MTDHATLGVVTPTAAYTDVFCQTYALGYALRVAHAESTDLPLQTPALLASLSKQNDLTIEAIQTAYKAMDDDPQYLGLCNRLQDRLLAHQKLGWMLRVTAQ